MPGHTYRFYSVARDNVGNEELPPTVADAFTTVPTNAPVLAAITNFNTLPGWTVVATNHVLQGAPSGTWLFTLDAGAPAGASINPTSGVFRWTPDCSQASRTNTITVRVTDTGWTNMTDSVSFIVAVGECVQPGLGQQILLAGDNGRVPIWLISSVPLTNLDMTLVTPPGRLVLWGLQAIVPEICATSITPLTNLQHQLSLLTCPAQWLIGTPQVAWLNFTAASNQSSAFAGLSFTNLAGYVPDGTAVANFAPQEGRVVVVGEEPLLEMVRNTNRQPLLILYGKPASGYSVEWRTNLFTGNWQPVLTNLTMGTNLFLEFTPPPGSGPFNFYRGVRVGVPGEPRLEARLLPGGQAGLVVRGTVGASYTIESTATLGAGKFWQPLLEHLVLTNSVQEVPLSPGGAPAMFYRAIGQGR
jgi:hypothetical protein